MPSSPPGSTRPCRRQRRLCLALARGSGTPRTRPPPRVPLDRQRGARSTAERAGELVARGDVELAVDLVEVVLDRAGADEQPGADLRIRQAVAGEPRDLRLSCGELVQRFDAALASGLPAGPQLPRGALRERVHAHRREHLVRGAQLLAGIQAPFQAAEPFAVEQVGAGELWADPRAGEALDGLAVEALGV